MRGYDNEVNRGNGRGIIDQTAVRRGNLARVLGEIREAGVYSRAALASRTGLTKATVSNLVNELIGRRLIREAGRKQSGSVGRPSRILELDGGSAAALGLEVNANCLAVRGVDLAERVLLDRRVGFDAVRVGPSRTVDELSRLAAEAIAELESSGIRLVGVGVAVPGLVDVPSGTVRHAPNLGWQDVPITEWLRGRLDLAPETTITVDNEANLAALAEFGDEANTVSELVYLTGELGIGSGLITAGRLLRGSDGYSGEIGHFPVDPYGRRCRCGQHGCLETKIGLAAAVRTAAPDLIGTLRDPDEQARILLQRAEAGDQQTLAGLDEIGRWLGIGISIAVNMLNPGAVVLGGYFATVSAHVVPTALRELRSRAVAGRSAICPVTASVFGFTAAVRGAAIVITEEVFRDPCLVPPDTRE
ncbi:Sugar kinase of the NBD/HSP70 family, may contain an N-terminal HTH domain [Actinopolyspora alba]|uniref:Sugar kinase of the NBD/HSP70 family, may contain an N-terminal HTH domain n=1 Tax=Actinopolyspora alba TaxID=673379 RepID=A0A1I1ZLT5_9ACTN|nr:ROK family transcriptional regulator [Actinopolyspora alba]SFE32784.1 Sugar kinase of the NBD/HSP70 family, may contain an N-terminal HTH domain [Actinopolyspora alba]